MAMEALAMMLTVEMVVKKVCAAQMAAAYLLQSRIVPTSWARGLVQTRVMRARRAA